MPEGFENLDDDQMARLLFGDKAVDEMNRLVDHEPPKSEDQSSDEK